MSVPSSLEGHSWQRSRSAPTQTATFAKRSEARKWAQMTEGAIVEGPHFPTSEAKRRTVDALTNRYVQIVLPQKSASHARMQRQQLRWWRAQFGR
jgi:hypothetical protein